MARRANIQHDYLDEPHAIDRLGRRPSLASAGGPAGVPKGKRRDTKPRRKGRKRR